MFAKTPTTHRQKDKLTTFGFLFATLFVTTSFPLHSEESEPATAAWHLMPEPAFMQPDFEFPVPGTKQIIVTPVLISGDDVTYLKRETLEEQGIDLASINALARQAASADLARLDPKFVRDENGILQFAVIDSDLPIVAPTVLAPDFIDTFRETLGPDLLVAIPNRYRIYVFPALASRFAAAADSVLTDYGLTPYPISKEVFRVTPDGLEAIGTFEEK